MKTLINNSLLTVFGCLIICFLPSCNEEETIITDALVTAEDIENEFGFIITTPHEVLLERYGSWEKYRALLVDFNVKKEEGHAIHTENIYKVRLYNDAERLDETIEAPFDLDILEAALENGIDLPYSDRAGVSPACAGQLMSGEVDQSEQSFLEDEHLIRGYVLLCVAYALGDCTIETHQEDEIF